LRLPFRFVWLLATVVTCVAHLALRAVVCGITRKQFHVRERAYILHRWSRYALLATGTHAHISGPVPQDGVVVANHLSYLDILLMATAAPVVFVSKKEVGAYPLIGQTAALAGTIFIDRGKSVSTQDVATEMDDTLKAGTCVAFFPEGTTTDGHELLRFRAALFAAPIRLQKPVHTAAFRYTVRGGGDAGNLVCFWGDAVMVPHLFRLLMLPGVDATLQFGPSFVPAAGEQPAASRAAANYAHDQVEQMLIGMGALAAPQTVSET
jgi:1-acyl-sn-glycerol-3-phosphate acyltransferase